MNKLLVLLKLNAKQLLSLSDLKAHLHKELKDFLAEHGMSLDDCHLLGLSGRWDGMLSLNLCNLKEECDHLSLLEKLSLLLRKSAMIDDTESLMAKDLMLNK